MIEIQIFLVELVGSFEFELAPEVGNIVPASSLVSIPMLEGQLDKGAQLPLRLRIAPREEEL